MSIFYRILEAWLISFKSAKNNPHIKKETKRKIKKMEKSLKWFLKMLIWAENERNP